MRRAFIIGTMLFSLPMLAISARGQERSALRDARVLEQAIQDAIQKAEPSIACISVARTDGPARLDSPDTVPESYGSGVVLDEKGSILTNYHVVRDYKQLYVRLPGQKGSYADISAADPRSDLAVLYLRTPDLKPYQPLKLGDGDNVRKGQFVISIANPFAAGFVDGSPSASWGIIGNLRRRAPDKPPLVRESDRAKTIIHHYGTLLQTDARLNLGCSGGALVDLKGEMVGLTTAYAAISGSETSGGFAVPMGARLKKIVQLLKEGKEVEYGFLGVQTEFTFRGVRVSAVVPGSPASQAGLREYETIVSVDGTPIKNTEDLFLTVGTLLAGTSARLDILERREPVTVTLAKFYFPAPSIATTKPTPVKGLRVDYTSVLYQRLSSHLEIPPGVYVNEIIPDSPAAKANLLDSLITQVNNQEVNTPSEFYRAAAKNAGSIELTVTTWDGQSRKVRLD